MSQLFKSSGQSIGASTSASFILPEYSASTAFRVDWLDLLAVQGTLDGLRQHPQFKSISSSVLSLLQGPVLMCTHD